MRLGGISIHLHSFHVPTASRSDHILRMSMNKSMHSQDVHASSQHTSTCYYEDDNAGYNSFEQQSFVRKFVGNLRESHAPMSIVSKNKMHFCTQTLSTNGTTIHPTYFLKLKLLKSKVCVNDITICMPLTRTLMKKYIWE